MNFRSTQRAMFLAFFLGSFLLQVKEGFSQAPAAPAVPAQADLAPAADAQGNMQPTVEALIGTAVSLSNQKYPEIEKAIQRFRNGDSTCRPGKKGERRS